MPRLGAVIFVGVTSVQSATAGSGPLTMICENFRQEYTVRFDRHMNSFKADSTDYKILAVEDTSERLVVVGLTVNGGPTFRAHFRSYKKIEFYTDNQLYQTDGCR